MANPAILLFFVFLMKHGDCQTQIPRPTTKPAFVDENCCAILEQNRQICFVEGELTRQACYRKGCCFVDIGINRCFRPKLRPCLPSMAATAPANGNCAISVDNRIDCGYPGITQAKCVDQNCCYAQRDTGGKPACYFSSTNAPRPGDWTDWTTCPPKICATGTRTRNRLCFYQDGKRAPNGLCKAKLKQTQKCSCEGDIDVEKDKLEICEDSASTCKGFKSLCDSSDSFKKTLCRKTCGQCADVGVASTPAPPKQSSGDATGRCSDQYESCSDKNITRLCGNSDYREDLKKYCRKTCGFCQETKAQVTIPPPKAKITTPPAGFTPSPKAKITTPPAGFGQPPKAKITTPPTGPTFVSETEMTLPTSTVGPDVTGSNAEPRCEDQFPYCQSNKDLCKIGSVDDIQSMNELCPFTCEQCGFAKPATNSPTRSVISVTPQAAVTSPSVLPGACSDDLDICRDHINLCSDPQSNWNTLCRSTCGTCETQSNPAFVFIPPTPNAETSRRAPVASTVSYVPEVTELSTVNTDCIDQQDNCADMITFCSYEDEEIGSTVREVCKSTCGLCGPPTSIFSAITTRETRADIPQVSTKLEHVFTQWSICSVSCGIGTKTRMKMCSPEAQKCVSNLQKMECDAGKCPSTQPALNSCQDFDKEWCDKMQRLVATFCSKKELAARCKAACKKC